MKRNTNTLYILRFVAAIMVIMYHYAPRRHISFFTSFFISNGGEATNFFFFISGFVMIIANSKFMKNDVQYFSKNEFYIKRFARIYPLYITALLALAVFHFFIQPIDTGTVKYRLPFEALCIQRWLYKGSFNYPGWTISAEFLFYLIFPYAFVFMEKNVRRFNLAVFVYYIITLVIGVFLSFLAHKTSTVKGVGIVNTIYLHPVFLTSVFLFGMVCGRNYVDNKTAFFYNKWNNRICIVLSIVTIFIAKYYLVGFGLVQSGLLAPVYYVLVTSITSFGNQETRLFNSRVFLFLGDISYGIYILQYPVYVFFTHYILTINSGLSLFYYMLFLISVGGLAYFSIEKPAKTLILSLYNKRKFNSVILADKMV